VIVVASARVAVGTDREVLALKGDQTKVINLNGRTAIPGLNDSHIHLIRGGLNYNLELRWDARSANRTGIKKRRLRRRFPGPR
jgi:hypothetical protein